MKILRVIPSIDPEGGGPMEAARNTDAALSKLGHQVDVVCLDEPHATFLSSYPVKVHALGPSRFGYRYNSHLAPWIKEHRKNYDAVIVDGLWQYHGFAAWKALAGTSTPYYVFTHGMLDPWFKLNYPLKHLKKWLYWPWAEYRVLRDAKAVLFTCEEERRLAKESFWLYRVNEAVTSFGTAMPPADEGCSDVFLQAWPELHNKRIILFLSRIHEKKGCDLLIQAFANVARNIPRLHLVMAGPDQTSWVNNLKAQADNLGISDQITWTGMLSGSMKWGAFHSSEVFILPSHQENFGIVVAEALGCGKPVLISNKVNIWREIETDKAGLVANDDLEGTETLLRNWLMMDETKRTVMSSNAVDCFNKRFTVDAMATSLLNIIS